MVKVVIEVKGLVVFVVILEIVFWKVFFFGVNRKLMDDLVILIYRYGDEWIKVWVMLCDIY